MTRPPAEPVLADEYGHHAPGYDLRGPDFDKGAPEPPPAEPHEIDQLKNPPAPPQHEPPA